MCEEICNIVSRIKPEICHNPLYLVITFLEHTFICFTGLKYNYKYFGAVRKEKYYFKSFNYCFGTI